MYDFYEKVKYLIINKLRFSCTSFEYLFFTLLFPGKIDLIYLLKVLIYR